MAVSESSMACRARSFFGSLRISMAVMMLSVIHRTLNVPSSAQPSFFGMRSTTFATSGWNTSTTNTHASPHSTENSRHT